MKKVTHGAHGELEDMLQPGRRQVAAGYVIYGSSTMLVYTTGQGVHGFTLDPSIGEFLLSHPNIRMPEHGRYLSVNDAYEQHWTEPVRALMRRYRGLDGKREAMNVRYVGSLVADFHRNLLGGGIFAYPAEREERPTGKLRLLYECNPLAFIVRAGGRRRDRRPTRASSTSSPRRCTSARRSSSAASATWRSRREMLAGGRWLTSGETPSGIPVAPVYRPGDCRGGLRARRRRSRRVSRSRAACSRRCTAAASGRCASTPASAPRQETNERFRHLLDAGQTGLSVAFDLPTQMGIDSDSPRAQGEVGRVGVAIDTVDDLHALLDGIPLDQVSTSMTINATAAMLLAMYVVVAEERGVAAATLSGTIQNDILKEYIARGTYIYPPEPSLALIAEIFRFCAARGAELESDLDQRLPHARGGRDGGAGARVHLRERARVRASARSRPGSPWTRSRRGSRSSSPPQRPVRGSRQVPRGAAPVGAPHARALRRGRRELPAALPHADRRRHAPAQQPLNNVVRVAVQALAAMLGGTQSLHTNGYDEALALPTAEAATLALRTQQIVAYESGVAAHRRPARGQLLRRGAHRRARDGARSSCSRRWTRSAAREGDRGRVLPGGDRRAARTRSSSRSSAASAVIVGVNKFADGEDAPGDPAAGLLGAGGGAGRAACRRSGARATRRRVDGRAWRARGAAAPKRRDTRTGSSMPLIIEAVRARATVGEISDALEGAWGHYAP